MQWLALDIGGANLKVADGLGYAESFPFALWRDPHRLAQELRTIIAQAPPCDHLAVTMTGELADCFETKFQGVVFILEAVQQAADRRHTRVYLNDGALVAPQVAKSRPLAVAAANWHALARFAGRFTRQQNALLIDVGSTTCDIVPMIHGVPTTNRTDTERLLSGELVYAGVDRTPVCALVSQLPYRGQMCAIARELFATTRDVYILLESAPEDPANRDTADGRPATKAASRARLARMLCADTEEFHHRDAVVAAQAIATAHLDLIVRGIQRVIANQPWQPTACVLSGHGMFVAKAALIRMGVTWTQQALIHEIGAAAARCAPAHALAVLAREGDDS